MRFPFSIRRAVLDLSIPQKLSLMAWLFCLVVFCLLALNYFGMDILSSSRAYVGGEGLWSKAQKEAVLRLERYIWSHDEREYQAYLEALGVPLGDHQARLELEKPRPNFTIAWTGFQRGGNHPKDIAGMIHLLRRFGKVSYIRRAVDFWRQGDMYIAQLQNMGELIHREITSGHPSLKTLETFLKAVQEINASLTPLENAFSSTLGEGARWLKSVLLMTMIVVTSAVFAGSLLVAFLISRHLCREIDQLRLSASRVAAGDYSLALDVESKDEIGDLARSFQQMAVQRQSAERLKDELYANAAAANQELEAFSYSVSHDLRAPLRAIDGFSRELLENCESVLDDRGKNDLRRIRAATQRMAQLIDDLLELSHLSRREFVRQTVDVRRQAEDIVQKLRSNDPERSVEYVAASAMTAQGDPRLLQIALENLFANAWKFTRMKPSAKIEFGLTRQHDVNAFFIRDNGVGFNMAYAAKLFKPFQRLHDGKDFPGTGIGLALVERIIRRHGGRVWAEAEENKGAVFYFTL